MATRWCRSARVTFFFPFSHSPLFSSPSSCLFFPSYSRLYDRRLKSCPFKQLRNFKRNYFGSLSSSLYLSLRANSPWHFRKRTCSPKMLKCDGLFAAVSREKGIWQRVRMRDWWIRRSCLTIVSYKFLNEIGIWKPDSRRDIPMLTMLAYSLWNFACYPARSKALAPLRYTLTHMPLSHRIKQ